MDRSTEEFTEALAELVGIVRKLRSPSGCSWDREQTVESLSPFMLEEAYETADAVSRGDMEALRAELGDLLLHVIMSAMICHENEAFTLRDVVEGISRKLVRRHPHVFEDDVNPTPEEVERQWEAIKAGEKSGEGFFHSVPRSMPALQMAWRIQQRASEVGFDWPDSQGARNKIFEELEEFENAVEEGNKNASIAELGDFLFSMVNYCRLMGYEPEAVLRESNRKFMSRFSEMERILRESGVTLQEADMEQMDRAWEKAKSLRGE